MNSVWQCVCVCTDSFTCPDRKQKERMAELQERRRSLQALLSARLAELRRICLQEAVSDVIIKTPHSNRNPPVTACCSNWFPLNCFCLQFHTCWIVYWCITMFVFMCFHWSGADRCGAQWLPPGGRRETPLCSVQRWDIPPCKWEVSSRGEESKDIKVSICIEKSSPQKKQQYLEKIWKKEIINNVKWSFEMEKVHINTKVLWGQ